MDENLRSLLIQYNVALNTIQVICLIALAIGHIRYQRTSKRTLDRLASLLVEAVRTQKKDFNDGAIYRYEGTPPIRGEANSTGGERPD